MSHLTPPMAFDDKVATALNHAIEHTLNEAFQITAEPQSWSVGRSLPLSMATDVVCTMALKQEGVTYGAFIVALDPAIVNKILSQTGVSGNDKAMIDDAAEEITNMIYGLFKNAMSKSGYDLDMELPVTPPENVVADTYGKLSKMVVPFTAAGHRGQVAVAQTS